MVRHCYLQERTARGVFRVCYVYSDAPGDGAGRELLAWCYERQVDPTRIQYLRTSRLPVVRLTGKHLRLGCPVADAATVEAFKHTAEAYARRNDVRLRTPIPPNVHGGTPDARIPTDH